MQGSSLTYADFLLPGIRGERLRFNNEATSRTKVEIDLTEEPLDSFISPVEVNPLGQTEGENDIKFRTLLSQS